MQKKYLILLLILILALCLRIFRLEEAPVELFGDEIDVGIQANSILQTGKDYLGNSFPVMFQSFAEYRLPLFIYSAVPFVAIFGLNELGVRMASVFWGVLGILAIFLLAQKMLDYKTALFAAALLAISPWHLQYSRQGGIESVMLLTFLTFGVWTFLKGLERFEWLFVSVVIFSLSIYVYAISSVFVVIFGIFLLFLYWRKIVSNGFFKLLILATVALIILLPYANLSFKGKTGERFSTISVWSDQTLSKDINERRFAENHSTISSIFHNKGLVYFYEITGNYLKAISTEFLFFKGDPNLRHSAGSVGEMYLFETMTLIAGLIFLFSKRPYGGFLFGFLLLSPLPASLTRDGGYHASRLITMLLPLTIISAFGFSNLFRQKKAKTKIILGFIVCLMLINIPVYLHRYHSDWQRDSWRFWQVGYKEAITFVKNNGKDYKKIYINNTYETSLSRFLFWYGFEPEHFQKIYRGNKTVEDITPGFSGFALEDRYYFGTINKGNIPAFLSPGEMYIVSFRDETGSVDWRENRPEGIKILKTVVNPFGTPIFFIVSKDTSKSDMTSD